ncbi:MAG TPA: TIR domain-containing protein [Pyrinomonadaceae bacterium]|nr:TIR domain-containing protein [Pyrinomonadaceae bacterium]
MGTYFYLSYARVDGNQQVARFFDDLSDSICFRLNLQTYQPVGFFDRSYSQPTIEWTTETTEALKKTTVLVALLSPAYMRDERAGKEWQIFFDRIGLHEEQRHSTHDPAIDFKRVIIPVNWLPHRSPAAHIVSGTSVFYGDPYGVTQQRSILEMLRSLRDCGRDYSQFVQDLADHIIRISDSVLLPRLEVIHPFNECHNCFDLPNSPMTMPIDEARSDKPRFFVAEGIVRTIADRMAITTESATLIDYQKLQTLDLHMKSEHNRHGQKNSQRDAAMEKLDVCVIDDDIQILGVIEETCNLSGMFDVHVYEDASLVLRDLRLRQLHQQDEPDLFVVDLELKAGEMQGLELIKELAAQDIRSAILVVSGQLGAEELSQAVGVGAVAAIPKPFSLDDLLDQIEHWANVGRKTRLFGKNLQEADDARNERPVFLSYCAKDVQIANQVRRNLELREIGVWYAEDTLKPGDEWRERIRHGLTQANVFVPLITEAFSNSSVCKAELANMLRLVKTVNGHQRWLMPVLYNYSAKDATDELIKRCLKYQCVTMTDKKFVDGFTTLLVRIQRILKTRTPRQ